jgi:N-dimethylarginine dimethylaminohydrolase
VYVICPNTAAFADLKSRMGSLQCTLTPVVVDHPMTAWARDRWIALQPSARGGKVTTLVSPRGEMGAENWPERKGDENAGDDLARAIGESVVSLRSDLYFDGGDFVADSETAFVTPNVLKRNLGQMVQSREELIERLERLVARKVLLLEHAPDHHACMFMMPVGNHTVIVADPRLASKTLSPDQVAALPLPGGPDFSDATCARFDAVAEQCGKLGYKVVRMPLVPAPDGRTFLAGLNVILDQQGGKRIAYMPTFDHAEVINESSARVWQDLGYEVRPVNCTSSYRLFGSLRCLVNVLRRG